MRKNSWDRPGGPCKEGQWLEVIEAVCVQIFSVALFDEIGRNFGDTSTVDDVVALPGSNQLPRIRQRLSGLFSV